MPTLLFGSAFSARPFRLVAALLLMLWPLAGSHGQAKTSPALNAAVVIVPPPNSNYARLVSVSASPTSVPGGTASTGAVTVNGTAPSSAFISLSSSDPAVQVPANVTVAGTATSAAFPITTKAVSASVTATITASETFTSNVTSIIQFTTTVTVTPASAVLTSIAVSPTSATLTTGGTQTFAAVGYDQNGTALAPQPAFTWTATGVGTVSSTGVYSAGPTAGSATVKATSGTVSGTAAVMVTTSSSQMALSLTAAATGTNKVTLYWNGISGASGYNVYRSTISGGPYTQIAQNVATADTGPGMTNAFMYSDASGLAMGTKYFYVITAVYSGTAGAQSNEANSVPDASAIPWDTGTAAQIVAAVNATAANDLLPDDDGSGGTVPQQVGVLFIGAPDGVVYVGNLPDGTPPAAYPPSGQIVGDTLVSNDGTVVAVPDDNSNSQSSASTTTKPADALSPWSGSLISPLANIPDSYPYQSTPDPTGIYRKIESVPGFSGLNALLGLPSASDSQTVMLVSHPSTITPANGGISMNFPTVGDIYSGGYIYLANGAQGYPLDAGLQLVPHPNSSLALDWSPIVYSHSRVTNPNNNVTSPGTADKIYLDGSVSALPVGKQPGALLYKMAMSGELVMQFLTPNFASVRNQSVRLHFSVSLGGAGTGRMTIKQYNPINNNIISTSNVFYITLEYFGATGWDKVPGGNNRFVIKRVNSLAQVLNVPNHSAHPGAPTANAPDNPYLTQGYLADGSYVRAPIGADALSGAYWGSAYSQNVQLYSPASGWQSWTDASSMTLRAGSYPARGAAGNGAITYAVQNPFFWEDYISLIAK